MRALAEATKYPEITSPIIGVANMSLPSNHKRLYLYNRETHKLIKSYYVSHGVNTAGANKAYAVNFSNKMMSRQSSLGAMITQEEYVGKHGRSLKLKGLEKGINDNVRIRHIVIHAADYCTDDFIRRNGRTGCSWGCPAVSPVCINEIIDMLKDGHFFYIFF
jgi:hypothetical protein